ncbi:MAG: hypothetical protein ACJ75G_02580 [Gaiellaceae bacterium]
MKKVLPFALAALMIPSVALAKGPNPDKGTHSNHGKAKVMYVLKGMLSDYTAYTPAANGNPAVDGQVTIEVQHSNRHGKLLVGQSVTIDLGQSTKVRLENGVAAIAPAGDYGMVKLRASRLAFKTATLSDLQAALLNQPAHMVIDWGAASSS